ncbi:hypothetical protein PtA15_14A238 [Puccinia triticina]|uniref:Uncharacterized protein n=1 Tax=Puccinia triticina TaxID=208348 RepID=A0ABY7D5U0_9BASI|nr:uncharacterized protein PtA15_14A238 [Puccinia triticina]WAQ91355.1 hypothetical protein PtA15_14A238 [Puccinia triticina]WAR62155.1 hypothetical protein PtB15_14B249 [Puccinia triticina]
MAYARPDAQAASAASQRHKAVYHALIKARNAKLKEDNLALISTWAALRGQLAEQAKVVAIQAANLAAVYAESSISSSMLDSALIDLN